MYLQSHPSSATSERKYIVFAVVQSLEWLKFSLNAQKHFIIIILHEKGNQHYYIFLPRAEGNQTQYSHISTAKTRLCNRLVSTKALVAPKTSHLGGSERIHLLPCNPKGQVFGYFSIQRTTRCTELKQLVLSKGQSRKIRAWQIQFICTASTLGSKKRFWDSHISVISILLRVRCETIRRQRISNLWTVNS